MRIKGYIFHTVHVLKRFVVLFISIFVSFGALAFELQDLTAYNAVAIKTMKPTDTIRPDKKYSLQITGTKDLEKVLGTEKKEFKTLYVYVGDTQVEEYNTAKWYYYYQPSWNGRGRGKLNYKRNQITESGKAGDTLFVARKNNDELLFLIVEKDNPIKQKLLHSLGLESEKVIKEPSFWQRLWGTKSEETSEYEIEEEKLSIPKIPEKSWVRVYFTPGTECENNIIAEINNAKKIDIAVYSITNQNIVDALVAAKNRGAKVRVITDRLQSAGRYSLVEELEESGIPVVTNIKHKIMHNKFAVFDGKRIESGSYNWTKSASESNAENCMFFDQEDKSFTKQFNYLWKLYNKE